MKQRRDSDRPILNLVSSNVVWKIDQDKRNACSSVRESKQSWTNWASLSNPKDKDGKENLHGRQRSVDTKPWNCLSDYSKRAEMPGVCASRRVLCIANDTSGGRGIGFFVRIICSLQAWSSAKTHGIMFSPWRKKLAPHWTIHLPTEKVHILLLLFNPRFFSSNGRHNQTVILRNTAAVLIIEQTFVE